MAETATEEREEATGTDDEPTRDSRLPWVVMGVLAFGLIVGGIVFGKKEPKPTTTARAFTARAVIVPTADRARTIVVAPCDAPLADTVANVEAGRASSNATTFELPRARDVRTILVPHCLGGVATAGGSAPSVAYVLVPQAEAAVTNEAQARVIVPTGGDLTTIVVPRCAGTEVARNDIVVGPERGRPDLAVAPTC